MKDCIELIGDIIAVHLVPVGTIKFPVPFNVTCPYYFASSVLYDGTPLSLDSIRTLQGLATDYYYINNVPDGSVSIEDGASVKETPKLSSSGICYNTKISMKSYEPLDSLRAYINSVTRMTAFDAIIVDSNDRVFIVRGAEPSTYASMSPVLPVNNMHGVDVEMMSVNGLQPLVFE